MGSLDNGPEHTRTARMIGAEKQANILNDLQPEMPENTVCVGRYDRRVRDEWLDLVTLETIKAAHEIATDRPWVCNKERP